MKVLWQIEDGSDIHEGTLTFQDSTLNVFHDNKLVKKLTKATVEFITPCGIMINGFEEYDSKTQKYIYKRYYFKWKDQDETNKEY